MMSLLDRLINRLNRYRWGSADFETFIDEILGSAHYRNPTKSELTRREITMLYAMMDAIETRISDVTAELIGDGDENAREFKAKNQ